MSPRQKKTCIEKVMGQIDILENIPEYILETISPQYDVNYYAHTLLKLSLLSYYTGIFLPIAGAQTMKYDGRVIFIDALGGSGIVRVRDLKKGNYVVRGSSLVASLAEKPMSGGNGFYRFDVVYSIEKNANRYSLLKERFDLIMANDPDAPKLIYRKGDVNEKIKEISEDIDDNDYILLFIDPEGISETSLAAFNELFNKSRHIDVILNYNHIGTLRNIGAGNYTTVKKFVPTHDPRKDPLDAVREYFQNIGKEQQVIVSIRSKGNKEKYKILLCVRNTHNKTSFLTGFVPFAECMNSEINAEKLKNRIRSGMWFDIQQKN